MKKTMKLASWKSCRLVYHSTESNFGGQYVSILTMKYLRLEVGAASDWFAHILKSVKLT